MYTVYILRSTKIGRYYVGQTNHFPSRLEKHNCGDVRSTKAYTPWEFVHHEEFETRSQAMMRGRSIKNMKGGVQFKELLRNCSCE